MYLLRAWFEPRQDLSSNCPSSCSLSSPNNLRYEPTPPHTHTDVCRPTFKHEQRTRGRNIPPHWRPTLMKIEWHNCGPRMTWPFWPNSCCLHVTRTLFVSWERISQPSDQRPFEYVFKKKAAILRPPTISGMSKTRHHDTFAGLEQRCYCCLQRSWVCCSPLWCWWPPVLGGTSAGGGYLSGHRPNALSVCLCELCWFLLAVLWSTSTSLLLLLRGPRSVV